MTEESKNIEKKTSRKLVVEEGRSSYQVTRIWGLSKIVTAIVR